MGSVNFIQSASHWNQFPLSQTPQVALAGHSNSGKSSFINSLGHQKVAKVSGTPGKTCFLNIFNFKDRFWLIDMPGYGYTTRSHKERKNWEKMIEGYLLSSPSLKGLILLMDIRRQWSQAETQIVDLCRMTNRGIVIILNKADKLSFSQRKQKTLKFEKDFDLPCFAISSIKRWGTKRVINYIMENWINGGSI